jgi:hypothetical protein
MPDWLEILGARATRHADGANSRLGRTNDTVDGAGQTLPPHLYPRVYSHGCDRYARAVGRNGPAPLVVDIPALVLPGPSGFDSATAASPASVREAIP